MGKIIDLQQGTEAWLNWRKTHITASMAPVIMGVSKWQTPYQLWCELTGLEPPREASDRMKRGLEIEDAARAEFNALKGCNCVPVVMQNTNKDFEWMGASLDGWDAEKRVLVEIKHAGNEDHETARSGKVPDHYLPQLHHQMIVAKATEAFYYSYRPGDSICVSVQIDVPHYHPLMVQLMDFKRRLDECDPPELMNKDYVQRDDHEWQVTAFSALQAQKEIKEWEEILVANKMKLIELAQGKSCIGGGICFSRTTRKGNVDYSAIPELQGVDLKQYRKNPITFYRITKE